MPNKIIKLSDDQIVTNHRSSDISPNPCDEIQLGPMRAPAELLSQISTEVLKAELRRRMLSGKNSDWYFWIEEGCAVFVHKRFWHLNFCTDDIYVENYIKFPDFLTPYEQDYSAFTFDGHDLDNDEDDETNVVRSLIDAGFVHLLEPDEKPKKLKWDFYLDDEENECVDSSQSWEIQPATEEIHSFLWNIWETINNVDRDEELVAFDSISAFLKWFVNALKEYPTKLTVVTKEEGTYGSKIAVIEKSVLDTLPEEHHKILDDFGDENS